MFGYAGSLLIVVSLMMKSLLRLCIINMVGSAVFVIYGLLIGAYPVALLNGLVVGIDLYYLFQMLRQKDYFTLLEVLHDGAYLHNFINFYRDEINEIFPDFVHAPQPTQIVLFILRNMVPAGVLVFEPEGEQARVLLDYVVPGYRDFGVAKFLFEDNADYFVQRGIQRLVSAAGRPQHENYLKRMSFQKQEEGYVRQIGNGVARDARGV